MASEYNEERDDRAVVVNKDYCRVMPKSDPSLDDAMNSYLWGRSINPQVARHNYWYPSRSAGDDRARIVIPATSTDKFNKYWQARYIGFGKDEQRYQSPANCRRGDALVMAYPIRSDEPYNMLVVEGPMDAIACAAIGTPAIALMGVSPSDEVLTHVRFRSKNCNLVLAADRDAEAEMVEVMVRLFRAGLKSNIRVVSCAPWKDLAAADSCTRRAMVNRWFTER